MEKILENKEAIMEALKLMAKGMAGIFVALTIIMIFVWIMAKMGNEKK